MNNVEIFKELSEVSAKEIDIISSMGNIYKRYDDTANNLVAFHIDCTYDVAEDIVDTLNEEDEGGNWYVGAKDEEYVYVD